MRNDNSHLQFKGKVTKRDFEGVLINDFGFDALSSCPHTEESYDGEPPRKMTLYYVNGVHAGTWMKGIGWAFKSAYENKTKYDSALSDAITYMESTEIEPTSALKQAGSDNGISFGWDMEQFVNWAWKELFNEEREVQS